VLQTSDIHSHSIQLRSLPVLEVVRHNYTNLGLKHKHEKESLR
jgi:hypothetical protein